MKRLFFYLVLHIPLTMLPAAVAQVLGESANSVPNKEELTSSIMKIPGALAESLFGGLIDFFQDEHTAKGLAGIIIFLAIIVWIVYIIVAIRAWHRIRNFNKLIWPISKRELAGRFYKIREFVGDRDKPRGFLSHAWHEFEETVIMPENNEGIIYNTRRPHEYFNLSEIKLHFRVYKFFPGLFLGLGLLLTFIGLIAALDAALAALKAELNSENTLKNLLSASSTKFYASAAGLFSSIVLSLSIRIGDKFIISGLHSLCKLIEERIIFRSLDEQANNLIGIQKEQLDKLNQINTDMAVAIGEKVEDALDRTLSKHLVESMDPLLQSINNLVGKISSVSSDAVKEMADNFNKELTAATGKQFSALANTLEGLTDGLSDVSDKMKQSSSEFEKLISELNRSTQEYQEAQNRLVEELGGKMSQTALKVAKEMEDQAVGLVSGVGQKVGSALDKPVQNLKEVLGKSAEIMESTHAKLAKFGDALNQINDSTDGIIQKLSNTAERLDNASRPISGTVENLASLLNDTKLFVEKAGSAFNHHKEALDQTKDAFEQTVGRLQDASRRFENADKEVANTFSKIIEGFNHAEEVFSKRIIEFDSQLADCVGRLEGIVTDIQENQDSIKESADDLKDMIQ